MSVSELTDRISPYFTGEVLNDILKKKSGLNNIKIKKIQLGAESKKGDSYLSTLCRFAVEASGENENGKVQDIFVPVIVKAIPKNVARRKTFRSADFFETEIIFYEKVWPVMDQFKKSKNVNDVEVPLLLASYCDGVNDFVALEDLSYQNYGSVERSDGLNYDHTLLLIKLLAKFHGLSVALKDQKPEFVEIAKSLKETYFAEKYRKWYAGFHQTLFKLFRHAVEKELSAEYLDKFNRIVPSDLYTILCKLCEVTDSPFSVVTQGDAWIPNFLVKYDKDKTTPLHSILIDFQLARFTTMTNDLTFFLYSCVNQDILVKHWDTLIEVYHKALTERIVELGSSADLITLDALKADIQINGVFGLGMSMEAIPMATLEEHEVADLDEIQGEDEVPIDTVWIIHPFEDARNKRLAFLIKHGIDKGYIL